MMQGTLGGERRTSYGARGEDEGRQERTAMSALRVSRRVKCTLDTGRQRGDMEVQFTW